MRTVIVDTEGSGLHPDDGARISAVGVGWWDDEWNWQHVMHPFGQGPEHEANAGEEKWKRLLDQLSQRRLVFHNGKYDLHMLEAGSVLGYTGVDLSDAFVWDTMVGQRLLDPVDARGVAHNLKGIGLKPTCRRLFEAPDWDAELDEELKKTKPRKRYDLVSWDRMQPYLHGDLYWTSQLFVLQLQRILEGDGRSDVFERWMEITRQLFRLEQRGVRYRWQESLDAADEIQVAMTELEGVLPYKPTPRRAAKFYFPDASKAPEEWLTPTGLVSMKDEVRIELLKDPDANPYIEEYDHWCWLETAKSMWYQSWADKTNKDDSRLRTNYRQTKVVSGRFSCERAQLMAIPHNYQLQQYNLPEGTPMVREFIEAEPGYELWEVDVSQAEVRVGARLANCITMIDRLNAGEDPHGITTKMVFHIEEDDEEWFHKRQIGKRLTLATVYDAGAQTLKEQLWSFAQIDVSLETSAGYLAAFRKPFPEFKKACYRMQAFAERNAYVPLARGEKRWFQWFEIPPHKAFNQQVQGSVAVLMNCSLIRIGRELPHVRVLLQTHDSFLIEQRPGATDAADVARVMESEFEDEFQLPFHCDIKPWKKEDAA